MTEDEAKTKWCPYVRFVDCEDRLYDNRPSSMQNGAKCLGSGCMAWRWDYDEYGDATEGFCGLAGRP
jgi:hypothetical protein